MRQPTAASPSVPVTNIPSPTRAASRRIGWAGASPNSAIVIASCPARAIFPPITSTRAARAARASPAYIRSKNSSERPGRIARLTTHAAGAPPIAAISLRFTVNARAPNCSGVPQRKSKCTPSTIESIVTSCAPELRAIIAASSPGPSRVRRESGKRAHIREIRSNSPGAAAVRRRETVRTDFREDVREDVREDERGARCFTAR